MEAGNIKEEDNPLFKKLRKLISLVVNKLKSWNFILRYKLNLN